MFHTNPDTALEVSSNPPRGISVERRQKKLLSSSGTNMEIEEKTDRGKKIKIKKQSNESKSERRGR
jgi:hypothetical protein